MKNDICLVRPTLEHKEEALVPAADFKALRDKKLYHPQSCNEIF